MPMQDERALNTAGKRTPAAEGRRRFNTKLRGPVMLGVIVLGVVLSFAAFRGGQQIERNRIQASFERTSGERISALQARLMTTVGSLYSLASFIATSGDVTKAQFSQFVTPLLSAYPGVQAFEWVPLVLPNEREEAEAAGARDYPNFALREIDPAGGMRRVSVRDGYYPVTYVEPLRGNEKAVGFDLYSNPTRRAAIDAAIETRALQATGRVTLVQETANQPSFLVFYPLYDHMAATGVEYLRGLVLGAFRIGDVVGGAAGSAGDDGMSLEIRDLDADPGEALLYSKVTQPLPTVAEKISTTRDLSIGGRRWQVVATAPSAYVTSERGVLPWALTIACLFLTGNIVWLLDRRFAVEEEVIVRTREMRRARDEARAANRAKSDFLATMSHEIRTPLNGVISMVDHLLEEHPPAGVQEPLEIIAKSSEHLLSVIDNILDYSKLEARKLNLEERPFDVAALVRGVIEIFAVPAEAKGLQLEARLAADLPALVAGDPNRVRQIVFNLVSNALKFTERGHVTVEARVRHRASAIIEEAQGMDLILEVSDSGLGISEEALGNLFTEFWQADTSISRRFGGSGLGLAICNKLAKQMGGEIKVISAPGAGSVFTLTIPTKAMPAPELSVVEAGEAAVAACDARLTSSRILLVEDNPTNRRIARTILAQTGAQIDTAEDGVEAVAAARSVAYDVILMDVHMPNMNGLEATREIRALPAPFSSSAIVGLTASTFPEDRQRCRQAGMNDFLAKPYRGRQLREAVARAAKVSASKPDDFPWVPRQDGDEATAFNAPLFETETFVTLGTELGEQDARELLQEFVDGAGKRVAEMRTHLGRGEAAAIKDIAHSLKSSSAMIGLSRLAEVAREIEVAANRGDVDRLSPLQAAAEAALREARPFVESKLRAA